MSVITSFAFVPQSIWCCLFNLSLGKQQNSTHSWTFSDLFALVRFSISVRPLNLTFLVASQPPHTVLHWCPWYGPQPRAGIKSNNKDTVIVRRGWPSVLLRNYPASKRHCHPDSGLAKARQCSPALVAFIYNLRHETSAAAVPLSLPSTQRVHINVSSATCTEVQLAGGRHHTLLQ